MTTPEESGGMPPKDREAGLDQGAEANRLVDDIARKREEIAIVETRLTAIEESTSTALLQSSNRADEKQRYQGQLTEFRKELASMITRAKEISKKK